MKRFNSAARPIAHPQPIAGYNGSIVIIPGLTGELGLNRQQHHAACGNKVDAAVSADPKFIPNQVAADPKPTCHDGSQGGQSNQKFGQRSLQGSPLALIVRVEVTEETEKRKQARCLFSVTSVRSCLTLLD